MSEPTPDNPIPADEGTEPTPPQTEPAPPAGEEPGAEEPTPGTEDPAPSGDDEPAPGDDGPAPGGEEPAPGGSTDDPPPVVVPPSTGGGYQQGVDAIQGELTDEVNEPRWNGRVAQLTDLIAGVFTEDVLRVAYELAGPELLSRRMARDAAFNVMAEIIAGALQGAEAAAALEDQPAPAPTEPPVPGEG
ncbi:hypothetical protein [Streptomyces longwoodensis]|uniref:hypothetical protein n=1 Tax=Streptomyces longwoodensis TaxID=68231 RepID=UPI0036F8A081